MCDAKRLSLTVFDCKYILRLTYWKRISHKQLVTINLPAFSAAENIYVVHLLAGLFESGAVTE